MARAICIICVFSGFIHSAKGRLQRLSQRWRYAMARTTVEQTSGVDDRIALTASTPVQALKEQMECRTVLLQPEYEGNVEVLLRTLIAIARRLATERQIVVESA